MALLVQFIQDGTSVYAVHDKYLLISQKPPDIWNPAVYQDDQTISFFKNFLS